MTMFNKHWGINVLQNGYVNIYCPTISKDGVNGIGDKREIYKELKSLESYLAESGFKGWVSWTELINVHIMKFFTKIKAYPYGIDLKKETIWFKKEF